MRSRSSLVNVSKRQQKTHLEHTEEAPLLLTVDAADEKSSRAEAADECGRLDNRGWS